MKSLNKNAPSGTAIPSGAERINQANDNTESKPEQVPEEILKEVTEMHKRFMEIYKHYNYNIAAIGSGGGVQMSSEGFLDTFDKYELEKRDSFKYPVEVFTELNGVRVFAILSREEKSQCQPKHTGGNYLIQNI